MKVVTRNGEFERGRAMDIDAPLYSSLKSFSRKRLNGKNLALFLFGSPAKKILTVGRLFCGAVVVPCCNVSLVMSMASPLSEHASHIIASQPA